MSVDKKQFEEIIKQLIPISDLSPKGQNDAVEMAEILEFKKKKAVFKEGVRDNYSYYLLDGELDLLTKKQVQSKITSASNSARYAIAQLQPRQYTAMTTTPAVILRLDRSALDRLMVHESNQNTETQDTNDEMGVREIEDDEDSDWMTTMLQSDLFAKLPMANIQQLFAYLEPVSLEAGASVIKQGELGDNYYIISEGRCQVSRVPKEGEEPVKLAELSVGDSFGEEALLTDADRNATVTMLSDGVLMELNKDSFVELIKKPALSTVSFAEAEKISSEGGNWIDVRFAKEYEASHIESSTNIPLNTLRARMDKFESDKHYIICCDTGGRSSTAAFLLTQAGLRVSYLQGGLNSNSGAAQIKSEGMPPDVVPSAAVQTEVVEEVKKASPAETGVVDRRADSAVRASVLEADLAVKEMDIEASRKVLAENKQADEKQKAKYEAERKKLEQERQAIAEQKKLVEQEVEKKRREEEEKIEAIRKNAELKMQEEKKKLEAIYSKNTEEMKNLQEMKAKAEAELAKQVDKSKRELAEARSLQGSVSAQKKKFEEDAEKQRIKLESAAEKQRAKQAELEKSIKARAKALLEEEKRKLADQFAQNNEALEQAQKEKSVAEAGRIAAKEAAAEIIAEHKAKFEQEKANLKAQLEVERAKIEKESRQIRAKLNEARSAKNAAEAASKKAKEEAGKLQARQAEKMAKEGKQDKSLAQEMRLAEAKLAEAKLAEAKLAEAKKMLDDAMRTEKITVAEKEGIDENLVKQKSGTEKLDQQMQSELDEWRDNNVGSDKQSSGRVFHADHVKRIKEKAEAARRKTQQAADSLLSDVTSRMK